jgi:glyoxylase-like metal-dependent hydrolase (beta-lactamase superfamily II)
MELDRRDFLKVSGALTYTLAAAGCATSGMPAAPASAKAAGGKVEVHWLGQAATKLTSTTGKVIVIDPFLTNNPKTPQQYKNLDALGKVDMILVTHGHGDHTGDVRTLAERTGRRCWGPRV